MVHLEELQGLTAVGNQTGIRHSLGSLSTQEQAVVKHFMHKSSVHPVLAEADGVRMGVHLRATCTVCMPMLFMPLLPFDSALGATRAAWCSCSHLVLLSACLCCFVLFSTVFFLSVFPCRSKATAECWLSRGSAGICVSVPNN